MPESPLKAGAPLWAGAISRERRNRSEVIRPREHMDEASGEAGKGGKHQRYR